MTEVLTPAPPLSALLFFLNSHCLFFLFQITLLVVVILLTVFGNLMIMLCVLLHAHLRRPSHHFIASLSVADMLLGFTVMVPRLIDQIYGEWVFGYFLCQVNILLYFSLYFCNGVISSNRTTSAPKSVLCYILDMGHIHA